VLVVVLERLAKGVSYLSIDVDVEMIEFIFSEIRAAKRNLKGEAVDYT
jgi:hypothetical protein